MCNYTGSDLPGVFGSHVWLTYLKQNEGRAGPLMLFIGIAVDIYIYLWKNKTAELQESLTHSQTVNG